MSSAETNAPSKFMAGLFGDGARLTGRHYWGVYLFSCAVMILYGMATGFRSAPAKLDFDEWEYWDIAGSMIAGEDFPVGRRTPAFPALIAGLRLISDDLRFVSIILVFIAALSAPLIMGVAHKFSRSAPAALLCALAYSLWPPAVALGCSLYSEVLAGPLFLIFLLVLPSTSSAINWRALVISAVILALCAITRTMYLLFLPFVGVIMLAESRNLARSATAFAGVCGVFLLALSPWIAFASERTGEIVVLSRNGGETLAGGFNDVILHREPQALKLENRNTWVGPGKWLPAHETGFLSQDEQTHLSYFETDRALTARAVAWLKSNPGKALEIIGYKLAYMWGYSNWFRMAPEQLIFGAIPLLILQLLVLAAAIKGFGWPSLSRFYVLPIYVTGVAIISWGSWRFRQAGDVGLVVIAVLFIWSMFDIDGRLGNRKPKPEQIAGL